MTLNFNNNDNNIDKLKVFKNLVMYSKLQKRLNDIYDYIICEYYSFPNNEYYSFPNNELFNDILNQLEIWLQDIKKIKKEIEQYKDWLKNKNENVNEKDNESNE